MTNGASPKHPRASAPALYDICEGLFEVRQAVSEEDLRRVHALRFRVYCQEAVYFDRDLYPDQLERDAYDDRSLQVLLIYRPTGASVGAVRLILPPNESQELHRFPFDDVCSSAEARKLEKLSGPDIGEVSRFCLTKGIFREIRSTPTPVLRDILGCEELERAEVHRIASRAKVLLLRGVVQMCRASGVSNLLAVMEPFLLRMLASHGVHFIDIGPTVAYHGVRQPCYAPLEWQLGVLRREREDVWEVVTDRGRLVRG